MLPWLIRLAAIVPITAGLAGALTGAGFLGEPAGAATGSHMRYLSGLLLGIGLAALWCAADWPRRRDGFGLLCVLVTLGGAARALGWVLDGAPPWPHRLALVMELGVVPVLWWATRATTKTS